MENMENMENVETVEAAAPEVEAQPIVPAKNGKGMSIAALVCGILGLVGGWIPVVGYFALILSILGIVFGAKGSKIAKETGEGKGLATAGLVLGIIGTVLGGIGVLCATCALCTVGLAGMGA